MDPFLYKDCEELEPYSTLVTQIIIDFLQQYHLRQQVKQVSTILTVFFGNTLKCGVQF